MALIVTSLSILGCVGNGEHGVVVQQKVVNLYDGGAIAAADLPKSIAVLPLGHSEGESVQASLIRQVLVNDFASLDYQLMSWLEVDKRLEQANIELDKLATLSASLAKVLGVDTVLIGRLTDVQEASIGVDLKLYNQQGKKLWHLNHNQTSINLPVYSDELSSLIRSAKMSLSVHTLPIAEQIGRYAARRMPKSANYSSVTPTIEFVVFDEQTQVLGEGDSISIAMKGQAGGSASAMIDGIGEVQLTEHAGGEYFGLFTVGKNKSVENALIRGLLKNQKGVRSAQHNGYGIVNIDSQPPLPISELMVLSNDAKAVLSWQKSKSNEMLSYQVIVKGEDEPAIVKQTTDTQLKLSGLANFVDYVVSVVTIDKVNNQSEAVYGLLRPVADVSMAHAVVLTQFPKRLKQSSVLTKQNSPYQLNHGLIISESAVLFIEPGVEIMTSANAQITVKGELAIFGTTKRPVVIRTTASKLYKPFLVLDSDLPSTLQGVKISGMGVAIDVKQGDHLIENCQLLASTLSAIKIGGDATPILKNNIIANNKASGVVVSAQAKPSFIGNHFSHNLPFHIQSSSLHQLDARDSFWQPLASNISVLGDVIY
jgi:hypothetical protein